MPQFKLKDYRKCINEYLYTISCSERVGLFKDYWLV